MNLTSKKSGDNSEEVTPVPISNTVVKLLSADDTWWEAAWESRTLPVFYYLDLHRIEIKNCAQVQEACDARLFVCPNIFTIQREDSSHAVFFSFGNVSTFRKDGFLRSSMQRCCPSPLSGEQASSSEDRNEAGLMSRSAAL